MFSRKKAAVEPDPPPLPPTPPPVLKEPPKEYSLTDTLSDTLLIKVIEFTAPHLSRTRLISKKYNKLVLDYSQKKVKAFADGVVEALCWEHAPPTLHTVLAFDPLVIRGIIQNVYISPSSAPESDLNIQKGLFKAFRAAVDEYECLFHAVTPILNGIYTCRSQYALDEKPAHQHEDDEFNDAQDSVKTPTEETVVKTMSFSGYALRNKDKTWVRLRTELFHKACKYGIARHLPPLSQVSLPDIRIGIQIAIESLCSNVIHAILSSSKYTDSPIIEFAMETALATYPLSVNAEIRAFNLYGFPVEKSRSDAVRECILLLLDAAFNDPVHEGNKQVCSLGAELAVANGVSWFYSPGKRQWISRYADEVVGESIRDLRNLE